MIVLVKLINTKILNMKLQSFAWVVIVQLIGMLDQATSLYHVRICRHSTSPASAGLDHNTWAEKVMALSRKQNHVGAARYSETRNHSPHQLKFIPIW